MKHIDVMISCTSKDLEDHRKNAKEAVLRKTMFPLVMDDLVAGVKDPIDISLSLVNKAEIYVGIFAHRYGYIPDDLKRNPKRLSMTELEYRRAVERDIPILIFVMDDEHPSPPVGELKNFMEQSEEGKTKLKAFKDEITIKHTASFFKSVGDLRSQLIQALDDDELNEKALAIAGELDSDDEDTDVIPRPPDLYSVPPYIQTGAFIGRARELTLLDTWTTSDDPIMIVDAIGGQGKSALTWHWVQDRAVDFEGMMWWSFYERGATMASFMRHAIAYLEAGDPDDPKYRNMSHEDRKIRLIALLQSNRYLIVLDGLERILTAYHRLDKAQVRDDQVENDLRACTDPKDSDILYRLVGCKPSKILISTRLVPRTLEGHGGEVIKGVGHEELKGLHPRDAESLFKADNITFKNTRQLHSFLMQFGYHGLLLKMVAGRIKKDRQARGDFDKWYDGRGKQFDFTQMTIMQQRQSHILEYAMEGLDENYNKLLSRIAAFDDGVGFDTLEVVNPFESLDDFDQALTELEDRGLLQWDSQTDIYDLHPVVRGYAFANLTGDEKINTFNQIHDHFESQEYSLDNVNEVIQLQIPLYIYRALIGAERLSDAGDFYYATLNDLLFYNLIAYPTVIQLLKPLFGDGLDKPPSLESQSDQSYFMNQMSVAYVNSGDSQPALHLLGQAFKISLDKHQTDNISTGFENYGAAAGDNNQIYRMYQVATLRLGFSQVTSQHIDKSYNDLFFSYMLRGNWEDADSTWQKLEELKYYNGGLHQVYRAQMMLAQGEDAEPMLEAGLKLAKAHPWPRAIMEAYGLYIIHFMQQDDLEQAVNYAEEAITLGRRSGSYQLAQYLGRLARVRAKQGQFDEALSLIDEAGRGAVVEFDEAELHNCATEVYRAMGEPTKATENAINAYKIAWADGPPYANHWQLEQAKAHLHGLGVKYPDMPKFDASKQEKLPYEDELRAYLEELRRAKDAEDEG